METTQYPCSLLQHQSIYAFVRTAGCTQGINVELRGSLFQLIRRNPVLGMSFEHPPYNIPGLRNLDGQQSFHPLSHLLLTDLSLSPAIGQLPPVGNGTRPKTNNIVTPKAHISAGYPRCLLISNSGRSWLDLSPDGSGGGGGGGGGAPPDGRSRPELHPRQHTHDAHLHHAPSSFISGWHAQCF